MTRRIRQWAKLPISRTPWGRRKGVPRRNRPEILLSDYGGHAFTAELSQSLRVQRGIAVEYSFCSTASSPKGRLTPDDAVIPVSSGRNFEKYNLRKRLVSELRYGWNAAVVVFRRNPRVHVVCNMPLVSMLLIWLASRVRRVHFVIWFQDAQAGLAEGVIGKGLVTRTLGHLEGFLLRRADRIIAISSELKSEAERQGVPTSRIGVLENWAPVDEIPAVDRNNVWAAEHDLVATPVLLYSGTLAKKHRADLLIDLARAVQPLSATVVVVSEGEGAGVLKDAKSRFEDLNNLVVLGYQPFERLPEVLGSADILLALLEPSAGRFSVPSKVLSYLCAGRPVVAAMPRTNSAATLLIERAQAGVVVAPGDSEAFTSEAVQLLQDAPRRAFMGMQGRRYAEANFGEAEIVSRFLSVLA